MTVVLITVKLLAMVALTLPLANIGATVATYVLLMMLMVMVVVHGAIPARRQDVALVRLGVRGVLRVDHILVMVRGGGGMVHARIHR